MAEEIDENGFYREDFSTKSDWEAFNAQLGEAIQDWNLSAADNGPPLNKGELFSAKWDIKTETLQLGKKDFTASYYQAVIEDRSEDVGPVTQPQLFSDLMSLENTFCPTDTNDVHLLAKWYGIRRFVLVQPAHGYISNPSECSFFLSSASVVAAETNSAVPIFVPVFNPSWNFFLGVWVGQSVRINFDVVALETSPSSLKYLSGLLAMFKEKLHGNDHPATVSVRHTFALGNLTKYTSRMKVPFFINPSAESDLSGEESPMDGTFFVALPYGYFGDSRTELFVHCSWPEIAENVAIDSANYSDLVPMKAHKWSFRAITKARSYLTSALDDYLNLEKNAQTVESYVGRNYGSALGTGDEPNPLDQLTKSKFVPGSSRFRNWSPQKKLAGPIKDSELLEMISYIFPDMQPDALFPYSNKTNNKFDPLRIKSAYPDSLVARLSCLLATCNAHFGGRSGMAQLWANFTMELRYRLDNCLEVPGVAPGFPDMRTCLLHQKLQMLNICMERRRIRECGLPFGTSEKTVTRIGDDDEGELTEEDEFFDCSDEESTGSGGSPVKPQGRQSRLGEMKLIDSDEYLYVPATQDPVPKTEDQLLDDAEVMLRLGPGSGLSTQMMCSSLRSDMESFKAANPTGKIEDFIRWYSPRDWEEEPDEDGNVTGKLSARMTAPDNTWQSVWKQAQPVPAWRQKRLFDDTNEALKVLHYLETRTIGELYELSVVALLHSAVLKLKDIISYSNILEAFNDKIEEILSDLCKLSRDSEMVPEGSVVEVLRKIQHLEEGLFQYKSLEKLIPPICAPNEKEQQIIIQSLDGEEVILPGGGRNLFARRILEKYRLEVASAESGKVLPDPSTKEYIIRLEPDSSSSGPQFLRAIASGTRIRLCGAFSENTTFV